MAAPEPEMTAIYCPLCRSVLIRCVPTPDQCLEVRCRNRRCREFFRIEGLVITPISASKMESRGPVRRGGLTVPAG